MNHFPLVLLLPFYLSTFLIIQNSHLERSIASGGREGKDPYSRKGISLVRLIRQFSGYQSLSLLFCIEPYFLLNSLYLPDTRYVS